MRRLAIRLLVVLAMLSVVASPRRAMAAGERVVVVAEDITAPVVQKLRAELTASGYAIDLVSASAGIDFSAEAALRHARVVLRVSPLGDSIDLWVADREGQSVRFRERIVATSDDEDASVLAIRAQEAVHGKLLPIPASAVDPPSPTPIAATAPPLSSLASRAAERAPQFIASVGPNVLFTPGGLAPAGGAALGFSWLAGERFSVDSLARLPVIAAQVEAPEGTARVTIGAIGLGASYAFSSLDARWRPTIGAGLALEWSHVDGVANAAFVGHTSDLFAAMPYVRASMGLRMSRTFRVRVDLLGAVSAPTQAIAFAGHRVATLGAPMLDASLALEATW